jgi:hypothetical protein
MFALYDFRFSHFLREGALGTRFQGDCLNAPTSPNRGLAPPDPSDAEVEALSSSGPLASK